MSAADVGPVIHVSGRLNAARYAKLLENHLLHHADTIVPEGEEVNFVHDHASHDAHVVEQFFENHPHIIESNWPRKYMDCNPFENLFGHVVLEWENGAKRNRTELVNHTNKIWDELRRRPQIFEILGGSMINRLRKVIAADGDMTSY